MILIYAKGVYRAFIPKPKHSLKGGLALITGAGYGVGREMAIQLAKMGVAVICVDINDEGNEETAKLIKRETKNSIVYTFNCDVSQKEQVFSLQQRVQNEIGDVTILINNAGVQFVKPITYHCLEEIEQTIRVNLLGQIWMCRAFLPRMLKAEQASIVSMAALAGYGGVPHMLPFTASKHGVKGFMEGLYVELRQDFPDHRVHLMTVAPFTMDTGKTKGAVIKLPGLANVVSASEAARLIIEGLQRRETVIFIPWVYFYIMNFLRTLPLRLQLRITDFIDTSVDINYDSVDFDTINDQLVEAGGTREFI